LIQVDGKHGTATIFTRFSIVFVSVFALGALAYALPSIGSRFALPILPSGIAVAASFRWGRRMWPAVFLAGMAIELSLREPLVDALGVGAGLAGGAWVSAWLLERGGFDATFSRSRDVPLFMLSGAIGMALAPTFGLLGIYFADSRIALDSTRWVSWWSNTTSGVFLLAPILMTYNRQSLGRLLEHWLQGAYWLLGLVVCCGLIIVAQDAVVRPLVVVLSIILIVVAAIRFGLVVAASGSFAITTMTSFSTAFGVGIFAQLTPFQGHAVIWSYIASLSGLSLIITALLSERDAAGLEKLRAEQRYAQIFNGSPQPLWVHARDTLRFLLANDAALRQYGWSREELLSRSIETLASPGDWPVLPPPEDAEAASQLVTEPFETHHATKDGRVLEVEVWTRSIDFGGQQAELVFAIDVTERRAFGQALMDAIGGEQRRIAEELHDGLGQELTGLALSVRALANRAQKERDAISADLHQLALLATGCIQDAHRIVQGLSPLTNADGNLDAALGSLARRSCETGTRVQFSSRHDVPTSVDLKVRNHLYRIAQDAVQNALKHCDARSVDIELAARPGSLILSISDDGHALDPGAAGISMRTMRFRASAIGAKLSLRRGANGGNSMVCRVSMKPLNAGTT
jgi:PAS domain S-box-containing protein